MQRNLPHTLPDDFVRTWNVALESSKATVSRVGSELLRQGTAARDRFDALPSPYRVAIMSCLLGGAGQISMGQTKKGALMMCVCVLGLFAGVVILDNFVLVVGNDLGDEVSVPVHVVTKLSFDQRIVDAAES